MSDLDLTAAFLASTAAYLPTVGQYISNRERIEIIVTAAAGSIEAAVRERVAAEIPLDDLMDYLLQDGPAALLLADSVNRSVGASRVRRIARGDS